MDLETVICTALWFLNIFSPQPKARDDKGNSTFGPGDNIHRPHLVPEDQEISKS